MAQSPLLFVAIGLSAALTAALALRRPLQRRWFAGTGLEEWRAVARRLPLRDRWTLYRANLRGAATEPRLAPLALQRGRMALAVCDRMQESGWYRWSLRVSTWLFGALLCLNLALLLAEPHDLRAHMVNVVQNAAMVALSLSLPRLHRHQATRIRRSVQRNQALVGLEETAA